MKSTTTPASKSGVNGVSATVSNMDEVRLDKDDMVSQQGSIGSPRTGSSKSCPICQKELHWFSRKRQCTMCNTVVCRECASRKIIPNEMVCRSCQASRNLQKESTGASSSVVSGGPGSVATSPETSRPSTPSKNKAAVGRGYYANLNVKIYEARGLIASDTNLLGQRTSSDPYCILQLSRDRTRRSTTVISSTLDPVWNQQFDIPVQFPVQFLEILIFDRDIGSSDDYLGDVRIPIDRLPNGKEVSGWMPVMMTKSATETDDSSPRSQSELIALNLAQATIPAGMIKVGVRLDYYSRREMHAYVRSAIGKPPPVKNQFNLNALYGPGMLVTDLVWFKLLQPIVDWLMFILFWENFFVSLFFLVVWIPLGYHVEYWPSAICFGLDFLMVTNYIKRKYRSLVSPMEELEKKQKGLAAGAFTSIIGGVTGVGKSVMKLNPLEKLTAPITSKFTSQKSLDEEDTKKEYEEQSLNGLVVKAAVMSPKWAKEMAAMYQPVMRSIADGTVMVFDIFGGRHFLSLTVFFVLLALGSVLMYTPFRYVFTMAGCLAIAAFSPVMEIFYGIAFYLSKPPPFSDSKLFGMVERYDPGLMSEEAAAIINKNKKTMMKRQATSNALANL